MAAKKQLWIIAYDITDPRRLGRVGRYMVRRAVRVQYSVFVAELTEAGLDGLLDGLEAIIDPRTDDVRAYPLPDRCEVTLLGPQMFPAEVMLLRGGRNVLRLGEVVEAAGEQVDWVDELEG